MTAFFRRIVLDTPGLRRWLRGAQPGDSKIYHAGHLASDREEFPELDAMARMVSILSETKFVAISQYRQNFPIMNLWVYNVTRTGVGYAPAGLMSGAISPRDYTALHAALNRDADMSITRAVRDAMPTSDILAGALVKDLQQRGLIEDAKGKGFAITPAAVSLMA